MSNLPVEVAEHYRYAMQPAAIAILQDQKGYFVPTRYKFLRLVPLAW